MNPMRNTFEGDGIADVERPIAGDRQPRAAATAQMLTTAFRGTDGAVRALGAAVARWRRQRRTRAVLMRCSDRTLADIGIAREEIAIVARGIAPGPDRRRTNLVTRKAAELRARLERALRAQREWRRAYTELMAYSDRELNEIGIRRADIAALVSGRRPQSWVAE